MALMMMGYRYSTIQECLTPINTEDVVSGPYHSHSFVGRFSSAVNAEIRIVEGAAVVSLAYVRT
jgi:hypothetical protein